MYNDVGSKIKMLAKVGCWVGIIVFVILGFILMDDGNEFGIFVMLLGALASWASSWITYGFGEVIENVNRIAESINQKTQNSAVDSAMDKINTLNKWRKDGLITEEEYIEKMENLK